MPIVNHPNGSFTIPFDADVIASYMYNGINVTAEPDTPEKQLKSDQKLIDSSLRSLWGDKNVRTTPGRFRGEKNAIGPTIRENQDDNDWRLNLPASNLRKVIPNPTKNFHILDAVPPSNSGPTIPKTTITQAPAINLNDAAGAFTTPDTGKVTTMPLRDLAALLAGNQT